MNLRGFQSSNAKDLCSVDSELNELENPGYPCWAQQLGVPEAWGHRLKAPTNNRMKEATLHYP